ncbi:RDD family protein [Gordonia sp. DT30]|uniref:RDD family protein n=1 Tax=unclassified Gordonia (in: high G+C Gram-positive bacteria) TaxID=2657482 RepID=UPI003CF8758B
MGRVTGSWLSGVQSTTPVDLEYRGADLGLPESGPGSLVGGWPRTIALLIDWIIGGGLSLFFVGFGSPNLGFAVLAVWFVIGVFTVTMFGFTPGQYAVGMRVARVDHGPDRLADEVAGTVPVAAVGVIRALMRQVLIVFLVPALMNDYNGRALHDRATGTAIVRSR